MAADFGEFGRTGWKLGCSCMRGLIVEGGGVLSHGSIVAGDFGIPAAACPGALRLIRDGQRIRLDDNRGTVTIESSAAAVPVEVRS